VNDARLATKPFQDYLIRNIREAFDLEGAAIILQFRSRVKSDGTKKDDDESDETRLPEGQTRRPIVKARAPKPKAKPTRREKPSLGRGKNNLTPKSRRPHR
jgi:hypothetical protein